MKVKPKSNGVILINGSDCVVSLHVNQRWEYEQYNGKHRINNKFLTLNIDNELFNKMFTKIDRRN